MPLDPLFPSGGPLPPRGGGGLPFAPGDLLRAQVFESLGSKRYRIIVEGRMLEAASEVALALGQEVVARVRHLGPPLHLEIFTPQEARAILAWPRSEGEPSAPAPASPARPEAPQAASLRLLAGLRSEVSSSLAAVLDGYLASPPSAVPPETGARLARLFAEALLAADPELSRIDGWIARLSERAGGPASEGAAPGVPAEPTAAERALLAGDPKGPAARAWADALPPERSAALVRHLEILEQGLVAERPWARTLREASREARREGDAGGDGGSREILFALGAEAGVIRIHRREGGTGRPKREGEPLRVAIFLSMSRLGALGAALEAAGKRLGVAFRAERPAAAEAIAAAREELSGALRGLGWTPSVSAERSVEPPAASFFAPPAHPGSVDVVI